MIENEIKKDQHALFWRGEENKWNFLPLTTNHLSTNVICHPNKKRMWWRLQQDDKKQVCLLKGIAQVTQKAWIFRR